MVEHYFEWLKSEFGFLSVWQADPKISSQFVYARTSPRTENS
jgi:hypothetical protein